MNGTFKIKGGKQMKGEITPQGAKNEALQILCAVLLTDEEVRINNIPDIHDVNRLIEILGAMGVEIQKHGKDDYSFKVETLVRNFRCDGRSNSEPWLMQLFLQSQNPGF